MWPRPTTKYETWCKWAIVTDFAFPQQAGPITNLSVELQKRLQQATIEVVNGIDATCSGDCLVEKLSSGIQPAVVVWGSPQPNVLSVRKPEVTLDAANTSNADYKQLIFQMLSNHFPDSEVFIPLPSYYNIEENNYEMDLALIHGVAICSYGLNRHSAHATVSSTSGSNSIFNEASEWVHQCP